MRQLALCRPPRPSGPPPLPANWAQALQSGACFCGRRKASGAAFCRECISRLEEVLRRHLERARTNRAFMFWWKFSAARLASQGQTLHLVRGNHD